MTLLAPLNHKGLLYAKRISDQRRQIKVDLNSPDAHKPTEDLLWLHMCALDQDTEIFLRNATELDPIVVNALLAAETRPRILIRKEGVLIIIRAMNLHEKEAPEDMISLRLWVENKRIITTRRRDIMAIEDIKCAIENNNGPVTVGEFLTTITNRVYSRMEPHIEDLDDRTAQAEEYLAKGDVDKVSEDSGSLRIRNAIFRRYIIPQTKVLDNLVSSNCTWLTETDKEHLVESLDRVIRYVETLNDIRDRTQIINDEIDKRNSARLNSTTYIFSVAATIFLPLSFLTGLMGINIGGMPGVENNMAFWLFSFYV